MDNTPLYTVFTFRFLQNFPGMRLTSHLLEESPVIRKVWSNNPDVESSIGSSGVGSSRSQIVCSVVGVIKVTFALRSTKKWESSSSLPLSGWCFSPNSWVRSLRVTVWNTQPYVPSSNNNNNKKKHSLKATQLDFIPETHILPPYVILLSIPAKQKLVERYPQPLFTFQEKLHS